MAAYLTKWLFEDSPRARGTTIQICGLWPFSGGAGAPRLGVPVGKHIRTGASVALDPITYFETGLIANPSLWIEGRPGLGKSTLCCRICIGLADRGIPSLVLGDLKGEYVKTITALGGQVIAIGRGRGGINPLDHDYALAAAYLMELATTTSADGNRWWVRYQYVLSEKAQRELIEDARARRSNAMKSLLQVHRRAPLTEREDAILEQALIELFARWNGPSMPVVDDLVALITGRSVTLRNGRVLPGLEVPTTVRAAAQDRGKWKRYVANCEDLVGSLEAIASGSAFGGVFSQRSTAQMRMGGSVVYDVSSIDHSDTSLQAAALLMCWNVGFGQVECQQLLADEGVIERVNYHIVNDELWRPLGAGEGMVDRISASTRLNRHQGVGTTFLTHSLADTDTLASESDRVKARGIAERCGVHVYFGLPAAEMSRIRMIQRLSRREEAQITSWWTPESWDQVDVKGRRRKPAGLGLCLIKVAGRRGIPTKITLTSIEENLHDTNTRWAA
jgi:hypothetical protein